MSPMSSDSLSARGPERATKSEMQLAEEATGEFRYLLNRMEAAGHASYPSQEDFHGKRLAVLHHVARLTRERDEATREALETREQIRLANADCFSAEDEVASLTSELTALRASHEQMREALTEAVAVLGPLADSLTMEGQMGYFAIYHKHAVARLRAALGSGVSTQENER